MSRTSLFACFALTLLSSLAVYAEHPVQERGFRPDAVYQLTNYDTVGLFNGHLNVQIPIGQRYSVSSNLSYQLTLRYSSNAWRYVERCRDMPGSTEADCRVDAIPYRENAGLSWHLSFGELLVSTPAFGSATTGARYTSPDGAEHHFYPILHEGDAEDIGDTDGTAISYTRDGSYLRMKVISSTLRIIEFPDGRKQRWEYDSVATEWRLTHEFNGFSTVDAAFVPSTNYIAYTYPVSTTYTGNDIAISDSTGRSHLIRLKAPNGGRGRVGTIELAKFGGGTAVYTFEYVKDAAGSESIVLQKPYRATTDVQTAAVSLLEKVTLPNGEYFHFTYSQPATTADDSGTLQQMIFPTLGKIEWDYSRYGVASEIAYDEAIGISARRVYNYVKSATPQYVLDQYTAYSAGGGQNVVSTMKGWDSTGANAIVDYKTTHHFQVGPGQWTGLPFTTVARSGSVPNPDASGRYLSTETHDCTDAGVCTPERATYVKYEADDTDFCNDGDSCMHDRNRRVVKESTLYVSDGGKYASVDYSSFDGLGHYRTAATGGNFGRGDARTSTTDYNTNTRGGFSVGTYSLDANGNRLSGFTMLSASDPWVLETYTGSRVTEASITAYVQACFDISKNFLLRRRILRSSTAGGNDLLAVYTPDASGNVIREEHFGGDAQNLGTTALCGVALPAHDATSVRIDHTYQYGSLKTSQYKDTAGGTTGGLAFFSADYDLDANTGFAIRSRDTAGIATDYDYDALGRLTWTKPQAGHGAWTQYDYRLAASLASGRAQVAVYNRPNGSTTAVLARNSVEYDGLGRVYRENRLLADNWWDTRDTRYDHTGRASKVSSVESYVSDTASPSNWTTTTYDAFGRPQTVTAPDGKSTSFSYAGVRNVVRTVQMGISLSGNTVSDGAVSTSEDYDRQGRLWKVTEAFNTTSAVITEYSYEVGGRLSKVCSGLSAGVCAQTRLFTYDKRGFLTSEQHPEKGLSGNGVVSYTYNARGNALTKTEGAATANFTLSYVYDRAERLTQVKETNRSARVVKQFAFGAANSLNADGTTNFKNGKLESATRYNYDRGGITGDVSVAETYVYSGIGGRASRKLTDARNGTTVLASFATNFAWNDLGLPLSVTQPDCTAPTSCAGSDASHARTVSNTYTNGFLTAVPGYATSINYHRNGMVNTVSHANGLRTVQSVGTDQMARPTSFVTDDSSTLAVTWQSGAYVYDGAGNVKKIGTNYFLYDRFGRVLEGSAAYTSSTSNKLQRYTYDPYGNMTTAATVLNGTTQSTRTIGITTATNRLCSGTECPSSNIGAVAYDDGGNQITSNTQTQTFDSQNMMATLAGASSFNYFYTADDERIWIQNTTANTSRWTVRGFEPKVLREYSTTGAATAQTWSFLKDYVYRSGSILAAVSPTAAVTHFHTDHLGSVRAATDANKATVVRTDYYPFGEEATSIVAANAETKKFTSHERDYNSGTATNNTDYLDYMHARYYAHNVGRFLGVDPTWESAHLRAPQSWNRYTYVLGSPIRYTDPDGRITRDDVKRTVGLMLLLAGANPAPVVGPQRADTALKQYLREALESVSPGQRLALTMTANVRSPQSNQTLHHFGTQRKSAETLARKAAEAEQRGVAHGVSTTTTKPDKPHTSAERSEVEKHFEVKQTGADPNHYTVVLPKPVTDKVADLFNRVFNRQ